MDLIHGSPFLFGVKMQTPIYWLVMWKNPQAIQDLDDYQKRVYKTHLDMIGGKAPWELPVSLPKIPVRPGMTKDELDKFMRSKPRPGHPRRVK